MKTAKYPQRIMPKSVTKRGYTYIPNGLIDNRMGFSPSERLYLQYLLMKPDGHIFYTRDISRDLDLHRTTINDIKKKLKFLKYTKTETGAYKSGWKVNFDGLWELISKYEKTEVSNFEVSDSQTEGNKHQTEGNSATIKSSSNPIKTFLKQKEEFESNEATDSQETREEQLKQPKHEIEDTMKIYDPDADDGLDAILAAHGINLSKPDDSLPIREKIKIYFSKNFAISGKDYEPSFNKANISDEVLNKAWKYISNWATYPGAKGTDRSLHMFVTKIDKFISYYEKAEKIETVAVYKADEYNNAYMSRKSKLINNGCWYTPDFQDDDNLLWTQTKKNKNLPAYLKQYMQNPTSIINSSGEIDEPEKYTKKAILGAIK